MIIQRSKTAITLAILMSAIGAAQLAYAGAAGNVVRAVGKVTAADQANKVRTLNSGDAINEGDTVITAEKSSVQLQMVDGALITLTAQSALNVMTYGTAPGNERVSLVMKQGQLRTTTGNVKKDAYTLQTPSAIVRIMGTIYEVRVNQDNKETIVILREGKVLVESTCKDVGTGSKKLLDVPGMGLIVVPCKDPKTYTVDSTKPLPPPLTPPASP